VYAGTLFRQVRFQNSVPAYFFVANVLRTSKSVEVVAWRRIWKSAVQLAACPKQFFRKKVQAIAFWSHIFFFKIQMLKVSGKRRFFPNVAKNF